MNKSLWPLYVLTLSLHAAERPMEPLACDHTHAEVQTELDRRLVQWLVDVDDPIPRGPVK